MKTIKEYAEFVGKSREAVYKQLKAKKNQERLKGHVWQQDGTTYLDDVAIEILNESRKLTQVKQDQQLKSEVEQMLKENNQLKNKIISLQDELKVKTEQMASLLVENKEKTLLLEQNKNNQYRIVELEAENTRLKAINDELSLQLVSQNKSESPIASFFSKLFKK